MTIHGTMGPYTKAETKGAKGPNVQRNLQQKDIREEPQRQEQSNATSAHPTNTQTRVKMHGKLGWGQHTLEKNIKREREREVRIT